MIPTRIESGLSVQDLPQRATNIASADLSLLGGQGKSISFNCVVRSGASERIVASGSTSCTPCSREQLVLRAINLCNQMIRSCSNRCTISITGEASSISSP